MIYGELDDWEEFCPFVGKGSAYFLSQDSQNLLDLLMDPFHAGLLNWTPRRSKFVFESY
jgi:hypothetical protein